MQTKVKCPACGLTNFSTVANCRRCFASLSGAAVHHEASQPEVFYEHPAPDGTGHISVLKMIGVLCMLGGLLLAAFFIANANIERAIVVVLFAMTNCALLFVIAIMAENLVAIRKNTAHLAGIRSNTAQQLEFARLQGWSQNAAVTEKQEP